MCKFCIKEKILKSICWKNVQILYKGKNFEINMLEKSANSIYWKNLQILCTGKIFEIYILEKSANSIYRKKNLKFYTLEKIYKIYIL